LELDTGPPPFVVYDPSNIRRIRPLLRGMMAASHAFAHSARDPMAVVETEAAVHHLAPLPLRPT
jgi:hypothetical protein